jgi:nicotinic acid mononucleotide adenylyltransferase
MLQAAIKGEPKFEVDECELLRPPPSYTIDTVEEIRRRECDASIYCLIGEDNVEQLPQVASLRRTGEDGSLCGSRPQRETTLTFLSVDPPSYRYFRH